MNKVLLIGKVEAEAHHFRYKSLLNRETFELFTETEEGRVMVKVTMPTELAFPSEIRYGDTVIVFGMVEDRFRYNASGELVRKTKVIASEVVRLVDGVNPQDVVGRFTWSILGSLANAALSDNRN